MTWIQTASGGSFDVLNPLEHQIVIDDIAAALSNICRFGGHTRSFYSVAQHCVMASWITDPQNRLEVLMHDAAEAYVGDMVSPLKAELPQYQAIELRIKALIWKKFGLHFGAHDEMRRVDLVMLATERRDLLLEQHTRWPCLDGVIPASFIIEPWPPAQAREAFLARFDVLTLVRAQRESA